MRETDSLVVFPCPEQGSDGMYRLRFFGHGLRHLPKHSLSVVDGLPVGAPLFLMPDPQNPKDSCAVVLRTDDPTTIVGYCPRFLTHDFLLLLDTCGPANVKVSVQRVNREAPIQYRLLCLFTSSWPSTFRPCSSDDFEPLATEANSGSTTHVH